MEVDRLVHEPARLSILSQLYVVEEADFLFVMQQAQLTQGNLSSHLAKLEEAGYVDVQKGFVGKRPRTVLRITPKGRRALEQYVASMKQLLDEVPVRKAGRARRAKLLPARA
jgi:DNA-binding MarR family transcriptional regulator